MAVWNKVDLEPRKQPQQARSLVTVEAIEQAAIQVLLRDGAAKLTTVRVAERAGISVGTLYQYFPHKQALLYAVLEKHLLGVMSAVEMAAKANEGKTVREMVEGVVAAFVRAKYAADRRASAALYKVSAEIEGAALSAKLRKPSEQALVGMFRSATDARVTDVAVRVSLFFSAMAGVVRAQFEDGGPKLSQTVLCEHLVAMGMGYFG